MASKECLNDSESCAGNQRFYTLRATRLEVNIGDPASRQYPAFRLGLAKDDERTIGDNLILRVEDYSPKERVAHISIRELDHREDEVSLENVYQMGDILCIGNHVRLVLRRFRPERRYAPLFFIAARRDLRVASPPRHHK